MNYHSEECASSAVSAMDGQVSFKWKSIQSYLDILPTSVSKFCILVQELNGRSIRVSYAQERERAPRPSYGGGRGGGYGNREEY